MDRKEKMAYLDGAETIIEKVLDDLEGLTPGSEGENIMLNEIKNRFVALAGEIHQSRKYQHQLLLENLGVLPSRADIEIRVRNP